MSTTTKEPGFLQGYWLRQRGPAAATATFTGSTAFFAVLRRWTTGVSLGAVRAPNAQGVVPLPELSDEPNYEGLLYLFSDQKSANDFHAKCHPWNLDETVALMPLLAMKIMPNVPMSTSTATQLVRVTQGGQAPAPAGVIAPAILPPATPPVIVLGPQATAQAAAPGNPPQWEG